ncbi:MAG: shikimate dehydrogenase [Chloroflexi bacterium]|jgi:shikimate dehydrogenase|nr:shikimate dehydrogenase [Chloroflexota bacterium]
MEGLSIAHIDGRTQLVGILGYPVAHSLSPEMHNAAFAELGMNWRCVPLLVHPDKLAEALRGIAALGFRGANVTVPHKVACIPYLDRVTESVNIVGAVNTIRVDGSDGRLEGFNTDVSGFLTDLAANQINIGKDSRVVILGAGGAARAIGAGLVRSGAHITLVNRTVERGLQLASFLRSSWEGCEVEAVGLEELEAVTREATLIVNATSVGMFPHTDSSPWRDGVPFPKNAVLYDTIYRPLQTKLMRDAERSGLRVIGGLGMLIHQGAAAFEIWTGRKPPIDLMRAVCLKRLSEN